MKKLSVLLVLFLFSNQFVWAQKTVADSAKYLSLPGPANQDTTKYATFYVMRSDHDRTFWVGINFNDTLMVRVQANVSYVIKYAKTGNVNIWSAANLLKKSSVWVNVEPGKKYYLQIELKPGVGKYGSPTVTLTQLDEKQGEEVFKDQQQPTLYVFDPDPATKFTGNSNYLGPLSPKDSLQDMVFTPPLSTRHYFFNPNAGFFFSYYNAMVSKTFTEGVMVRFVDKKDFNSRDDFEKFVSKQIANLTGKNLEKFETLQMLKQDTLASGADYSSTIYYVTENAKSAVIVNGQHQVLEMRSYDTWMYKKDLKNGKGNIYNIFFSERGLPQELHTREEIRFKIRQLLGSPEFGEVKK
jgi:hypothetical protein